MKKLFVCSLAALFLMGCSDSSDNDAALVSSAPAPEADATAFVEVIHAFAAVED